MLGKLMSCAVLSTASFILALCIAPVWAMAAQGGAGVSDAKDASAQVSNLMGADTQASSIEAMATAKPMNLRFKYSAYMTNGKGSAYKSYTSPTSPFGKQPVIYKARIKGNKLYLWGTYDKNVGTASKTYKTNGKSFKLTSQTKYYRHTGNNNFYEKWNKSKTKQYLSSKPSSYGGDIAFNVKNGKITALSVQ